MMDKTININIAGTLFQIDDAAFRILKDYLQAINNRFRNVQGGHETIEDIESRIAEIFQSQKGLAGVVSKENVESMISIIGKPEDFDHNEPVTEQPLLSSRRKRMYRNPEDSIISGVCGGIGAYLNTDPVLFRILFVIFGLFFGSGFILYIILWVALPPANTDIQRREMYGDAYNSARSQNRQPDSGNSYAAPAYNTSSKIGNAFNEVFRAVSRVLYLIVRIFLIIIGVFFVITGFLVILSIIMVLVFKFPGVFSHDGMNVHLTYYRDFLNYIVSPSSVPWIIALSVTAVVLPMLALIYAGVKMIFWFRAKDGMFSLAGFVLWILVVAALAMILFSEGISFAETGRSVSRNILPVAPDTLFIITGQKAADINFDKEFSLPDEDYTLLMSDSTHQLYIPARLRLNISENDIARIEIQKRSSARTRNDAVRKAESLIYNYSINNDTLYLPSGSRWTADFLSVNLFVPENTILYFDKASENLFHNQIIIGKADGEGSITSNYDTDTEPWDLGNKFWIISAEGLKEAVKEPLKTK
jgi:phage shock protein PspC (stress-responsive transcriptional regulator)